MFLEDLCSVTITQGWGLCVQGWVSLRQSREEALPVTCGIMAVQGFCAERRNTAPVSRPWAQWRAMKEGHSVP